jgi:hypothetical protein
MAWVWGRGRDEDCSSPPTIEITILASQPYVQDAALVRLLALVEQRHAVTESIEQRGPGARLILACRQLGAASRRRLIADNIDRLLPLL